MSQTRYLLIEHTDDGSPYVYRFFKTETEREHATMRVIYGEVITEGQRLWRIWQKDRAVLTTKHELFFEGDPGLEWREARLETGGDTFHEWRLDGNLGKLSEALDRARAEPTLAEALAFLAIWETERIVAFVREHPGQPWETFYRNLFQQLLGQLDKSCSCATTLGDSRLHEPWCESHARFTQLLAQRDNLLTHMQALIKAFNKCSEKDCPLPATWETFGGAHCDTHAVWRSDRKELPQAGILRGALALFVELETQRLALER